MRKSKSQTLFGLAVVAIIIFTVLKIKHFDESNKKKFYVPKDTENVSPHIQRFESEINPEQEITLGTFPALKGTCFLADDESEQYVFNSKVHDRFQDLRKAILKSNLEASTDDTTDVQSNPNDTIAKLFDWNTTDFETNLGKFYTTISRYEMYPKNSVAVDELLYDMATKVFSYIEIKEGGTQFKLKVVYDDATIEPTLTAIFKPARTKRDEQAKPNQIYYAEYERHFAEIAAFHVDRVLGSRRAMPVAGRRVNVITDIMRLAQQSLQKTFFISPAKNLCFWGSFNQYSDPYHPICGEKDMLEGSLCAYFPELEGSTRRSMHHPWNRTYSPTKINDWEKNPDYCEKVRNTAPYNRGTLLMELVDMSIFDFLIGNQDRHNYQRFEAFGDDTFTLRYDHGRAFGRAYHDELKILATLLQCCTIRTSTLETLLNIHNGPKPLSQLVRESMANDPISPILWEPHLEALDRRLAIVLQAVRDCINRKPIDQVLLAGRGYAPQ